MFIFAGDNLYSMASLSWYFYRFRSMSLPEISFRVQQFIQKKQEKRSQVGITPTFSLPQLPPPLLPIAETTIDLEGTTVDIFGLSFDYSQPINWHLDIASQREFPRSFAKDINIRTEEYGSAKHVWEVNRLQFLPLIALRYRQTRDAKYLHQFQELVAQWVEANPYLLGVNWYSNIEVNIRLIVWFFCWEILEASSLASEDAAFGSFVNDVWVPTIYLHAKYSYENPSKFSSANNHLISEHAGLFVAASYWKFAESPQWVAHAHKGLEEEIIAQHSPQGVNKEEAAEYIQFITDFFLIPFVVGERSGREFSQRYRKQLENILDYIYQLMDMNGNVPFYGDEDDGKVAFFDSPPVDNFHSLLTSGVILFGKPTWKRHASGMDNKNLVLFGEAGQQQYEAISPEEAPPNSQFYPDEGHFILRASQKNQEVYVHLDAAELGFLSIAAHGHADALSFVLHVDGHPVITDVGTYTYHTEPAWRSYFIGTLAHNTIRIDEQDQAKSTGPTMWIQHYQPKVIHYETSDTKDVVIAEHNGYKRLGITHRRELSLDKGSNILRIVDNIVLDQPGDHTLDVPLHLHPRVTIDPDETGTYQLQVEGARPVVVRPDESLTLSIVKGQKEPLLGWYSSSFQKKEPTSVLYGSVKIDQTTQLTTEITVG